MSRFIQRMAMTIALVTAWVAPALAGSVILTLTRTSLVDVTDSAGLWQYETGTVARGSTASGQYQIERRATTGGSDAQNTAAVRITMFLAASKGGAPENIILEGSHSYNTGAFNGSVSAASTRYAFMRGADAATSVSGTVSTTLTMTWTGVFPFALP